MKTTLNQQVINVSNVNECQENFMNQISPAILMLLTFARWDFEYVHVTIKLIVRSF